MSCLCLNQKAAIEHIPKTTADDQVARALCAYMRGNTSPHHQVAVIQKGKLKGL